jgi:ribosomal protein S21
MSRQSKVKVEVRNGDIVRALKIFKRRVMDSGHLQEVRDRKQYTKPTTVRRKQKQQAIRADYRRRMNEELED